MNVTLKCIPFTFGRGEHSFGLLYYAQIYCWAGSNVASPFPGLEAFIKPLWVTEIIQFIWGDRGRNCCIQRCFGNYGILRMSSVTFSLAVYNRKWSFTHRLESNHWHAEEKFINLETVIPYRSLKCLYQIEQKGLNLNSCEHDLLIALIQHAFVFIALTITLTTILHDLQFCW